MKERNQEKQPWPQAVKSEAAVLGSILRDNALYHVAARRLVASSFFLQNNRKLWELLPDLIARSDGQGVDAYQLVMLQEGGRLPGFEKDDREEIRAWLLDLQRNRWTGSLAEHVKAVAEAGWRR